MISSYSQAAEIIDYRGRHINTEPKPMRIASGSLASDEILYELLSSSKQLNRLVAVSTLADNPKFSNIAEQAKNIKGRLGSEIESIISLKPDLAVIASFNKPEMIKRLEQAGIKTFVIGNYDNFQDIKNNIMLLGQLTHTLAAAKILTDKFSSQLTIIKESIKHTSKPSVLSWLEDGSIFGEKTLFQSILVAAGAKNEVEKFKITGWQKLSDEKLATLSPDWIIASGKPSEKLSYLKKIKRNVAWSTLKAVKESKIILIPEKELTSASHHVMKAITRLQVALRPEMRTEQ